MTFTHWLWCDRCHTSTVHKTTETGAMRCVRCSDKKSNRASRRSVLRGCLGALAFLAGMASSRVQPPGDKIWSSRESDIIRYFGRDFTWVKYPTE